MNTIRELKFIFDSPCKRKVETIVLNVIKRCYHEQPEQKCNFVISQFVENAEL